MPAAARTKTAKSTKRRTRRNKPVAVEVVPEPETVEEEVVENVVEEVKTDEPKKKTKPKKRTFKLHEFDGGPKGGGSYSGTPTQAAKKASNRWVCAKKEYNKVKTFYLRETTSGSANRVYEFKCKRVKLDKPKKYTRGETEITVDSKIVML